MVPQHPSAGQPAQPQQGQGLGAPQGASNPYYAPNQALKNAQAQQASAAASKLNAERAILEQSAGLGTLHAQPQAPQPSQAADIANALASGQLGQDELAMAVQQGQVDPNAANEAMAMLQQSQAPQGLGGL